MWCRCRSVVGAKIHPCPGCVEGSAGLDWKAGSVGACDFRKPLRRGDGFVYSRFRAHAGAGAAFGVALGSACASISATLGATAAFLVGRYLARLSPVFPFTLLNYAFGLTRVKLRSNNRVRKLASLPSQIRFSNNDRWIALHSFAWRNRSALVITEAELRLMAAPAMMGLRSTPKNGVDSFIL